MAEDMTLSQFDLVGFPQANETTRRPGDQFYSSLVAKFVLRRHMGYFMINVYVPCSLLVVISWVGFWINREATSDRIALGVTTVLTMAFLGIDNRRDLPKVSYSTALDYFVGICFAFVLASIIQFASVHFFTKHGSGEVLFYNTSDEEDQDDEDRLKANNIYSGKPWKPPRQAPRASMNGGSTATNLAQYDSDSRLRYVPTSYSGSSNVMLLNSAAIAPHRVKDENCLMKCLQCIKGSAAYRRLKLELSPGGVNSVSKIDRISRMIFPITFIGFHVGYWMNYLNKEAVAGMFMQK